VASNDPRLKSGTRKRLRSAVAAQRRGCEHPHCRHPGVPIDYSGKPGPLAYQLDEVVARAHGGSPTDPRNVRPTHAECNQAQGSAIRDRRTTSATTLTSGVW
jgi:5-methylcytosine-specific restriction endonuclease McrA